MTQSLTIDQVAARARAAGITLALEPHDTEWCARAFGLVASG